MKNRPHIKSSAYHWEKDGKGLYYMISNADRVPIGTHISLGWRPNLYQVLGYKEDVTGVKTCVMSEHGLYVGKDTDVGVIVKDLGMKHLEELCEVPTVSSTFFTKSELGLFEKELGKEMWQEFDWETWGK